MVGFFFFLQFSRSYAVKFLSKRELISPVRFLHFVAERSQQKMEQLSATQAQKIWIFCFISYGKSGHKALHYYNVKFIHLQCWKIRNMKVKTENEILILSLQQALNCVYYCIIVL